MHQVVERIAREAGDLAVSYFDRFGDTFVESKGHLDLVTEADRAVERFIVDALSKAFPGDGIFGEEGSSQTGTSGRTWIVDPIDGTSNYVRKSDQWAVSIGLFEAGKPAFGVTHAPLQEKTIVGGKGFPARLNGKEMKPLGQHIPAMGIVSVGFHPIIPVPDRLLVLDVIMGDLRIDIRTCGAATISLIEVATGCADGYIGSGVSSWDVMAMLPALETLGANCNIDWTTADLSSKMQFICGTPSFMSRLPLDLLKPLT